MKRFAVLATLLATLIGTGSGAAQTSALKSLLTGDDSKGWEAVGRLDIGGRSFCTGTLITDRLVLTAAHCLFDSAQGRQVAPAQIEFLAGWRGGRATAYRDIRRMVIHPDYAYQEDRPVAKVPYDIALLELSQPIRKSSVTPLGISAQPRKGAEVGVVSYAHDRAESPALQEICHVLARQAGMLILSCSVDFGSSGAPIFVMENGVPEIVSVVSAKAEAAGREVSLGTALQGPIETLKAALEAGDGVFHRPPPPVRRLPQGSRDGAAGAKFLRP